MGISRGVVIKCFYGSYRVKPHARPRMNTRSKHVYQPKDLDFIKILKSFGGKKIVDKKMVIDCNFFYKDKSTKFDIDNLLKNVFDSLQHAGVIDNDKNVLGTESYKFDNQKEDYFNVVIYEALED